MCHVHIIKFQRPREPRIGLNLRAFTGGGQLVMGDIQVVAKSCLTVGERVREDRAADVNVLGQSPFGHRGARMSKR